MDQKKTALNVHEAAKFLGCHAQTVRRLARKGEIPAYKVGQNWRFRIDALQRWVDTHHERTRKPHILVVEDERLVRITIRELLNHAGYRVTIAEDGRTALERMASEIPDVVLLDLVMPVMDGAQTLEAIRNNYGDVPVIIVTGYPNSELMGRVLELGPVPVLKKPVEPDHLLGSLRMALGAGGGTRNS